ncbi:MAG: serine hydrolase [Bacteroidetes bacterium]|nr:serine hydrolase [Bacteroidota bacterium]MCB0847435.1 serine hydrolase [Bacteroidota bacterium]
MKILVKLLGIGLLVSFALGCNQNKPQNLAELETAIQAKFASVEGDYALAFLLLGDEEKEILINEHKEFHAASTMKTPVMIELYQQAYDGKVNLDDSILVKNSFYSIVDSSEYEMDLNEDSGERMYQYIGEKLPVRELMYDMIVYSSNLATNILIELVDAKKVTQTMRQLGAEDIQVLRGVEDIKAFEQGLSNTTTAMDLLKIYEGLAKERVVSQVASKDMIEILKQQHFKDVIPAKLPKDVEVAHKTGWITGVRHDSGIVYLPEGQKYVLVILSKNIQDDKAALKMMTEVSRMIYEFVSKSSKK